MDTTTDLKPGRMVRCTVMNTENGGYAVKLHRSNIPGFIPAGIELEIGEDISARYLCMHRDAAVLSIGAAMESSPLSPAGQSDWVSSKLHKLHLKRAADLIPPPFDSNKEQRYEMFSLGLESLIKMTETTHRTVCIKASSEEWKSRSVMLLYAGRVVGCIYTCKGLPQTQPSDAAMQLMIADLQLLNTSLVMYELPQHIMLPLSALFMGYRLPRGERQEPQPYLDYLRGWCESKGVTACMPIALPASQTTCLVFINNGKFVGAHHVEPQIFTKELSYIRALLNLDAAAEIETTVVPEQPPSLKYGLDLRTAISQFKVEA